MPCWRCMGQFLPFTVNKDWEWDEMGHYHAGFCFPLDRALFGLRFFLDFCQSHRWPLFSHSDTMWSVRLVKGSSIWDSEVNKLICVVWTKRGWQSDRKALLHLTDICGRVCLYKDTPFLRVKVRWSKNLLHGCRKQIVIWGTMAGLIIKSNLVKCWLAFEIFPRSRESGPFLGLFRWSLFLQRLFIMMYDFAGYGTAVILEICQWLCFNILTHCSTSSGGSLLI